MMEMQAPPESTCIGKSFLYDLFLHFAIVDKSLSHIFCPRFYCNYCQERENVWFVLALMSVAYFLGFFFVNVSVIWPFVDKPL